MNTVRKARRKLFSRHRHDGCDDKRRDLALAPPSSCEQVSESVFRLKSSGNPGAVGMDVVFFHGLQFPLKHETAEAHIHTWTSRGRHKVIWPSAWLSKKFPGADIYSVAYDGSLKQTDAKGRLDLYALVERVLLEFFVANIGQTRPVILVGHCYGGLIIKQLCITAYDFPRDRHRETWQYYREFLDKVKGIFYFATPHLGIKELDRILSSHRSRTGKNAELVESIGALCKDLGRLNARFDGLPYYWDIAGVGESANTTLVDGTSVLVVNEASARCKNFMCVEFEDHISICRPEHEQSSCYQHLVQFIHVNMKEEELSGSKALQTLPPYPVGELGSTARVEVYTKLEKCAVIGLWGVPGIGKSALCKALFNDFTRSFKYTLFVEGESGSKGEIDEEKLLSNILRNGRSLSREPLLSMWERIKIDGMKLLVAIDGIESESDPILKFLRKLREKASKESKFIVTARDQNVLRQINDVVIHSVTPLDDTNARILLVSSAFPSLSHGHRLSEWQEGMIERIVRWGEGHPLCLETLGRCLRDEKHEGIWAEVVGSLENGLTNDLDVLWKALEPTYYNLGSEEQKMFLEAATFFQRKFKLNPQSSRNWTLGEALEVWGISYKEPKRKWQSLLRKGFVSDQEAWDFTASIKLHQLYKVQAQRIAKDLPEGSLVYSKVDRLQDLPEIFRNIREKQHLSALELEVSNIVIQELHRASNRCCYEIPMKIIQTQNKLLYLRLENCEITGSTVALPSSLLVFSTSDCSGANLQFDLCSQLVILNLTARDIKRLPGSFCELYQLCTLYLVAEKLERLPPEFCRLQNLQDCHLHSYEMKNLPHDFGQLSKLRKLRLSFPKVEDLPNLTGLEQLQLLSLECSGLKHLPQSLYGLRKLEHLTLRCYSLYDLQPEIDQLSQLKFLLIEASLEALPQTLLNLRNLEHLGLICGNLRTLPKSLITSDSPENPQELENLMTLPESLSTNGSPENPQVLENLKALELRCESLRALPTYLGSLPKLKRLNLRECTDLDRKEASKIFEAMVGRVESITDEFD